MGLRVGDPVTLYSPTGADSAFGNLGGLEKTYFVGGLFRSGAADYDRAFMFMPLEQQQLFFGKEGVWDAIEIKVCLLYTSPSPRDLSTSRMPSSA